MSEYRRPRSGIASVTGFGETPEDAVHDAEARLNIWLDINAWTTHNGLAPDTRPMLLEQASDGQWKCLIVLHNFFLREDEAAIP